MHNSSGQPILYENERPRVVELASRTVPAPCANAGTNRTPPELSASDVLECIATMSEGQRSSYSSILVMENFALRDVVKYGLILQGFSVPDELFRSSTKLPTAAWIRKIKSELTVPDIRAAFLSGLQLLANLNDRVNCLMPAPSTHQPQATRRLGSTLPDPSINYITVTGLSYIAALKQLCEHAHIPLDTVTDESSQSPFYIPRDLNVEYEQEPPNFPAHLKPDMRPTLTQQDIPHHPCYDLLPWPVFRSKLIMACSLDPPLIDEDDLCLDIMNDGIRCWGSAMTMHGRGEGAPWDSRSWEAMPWFLEKWEVLTGGKDGEMWRNSEWWRFMRHE